MLYENYSERFIRDLTCHLDSTAVIKLINEVSFCPYYLILQKLNREDGKLPFYSFLPYLLRVTRVYLNQM